jgi:murein DD-endopeptidase MepM/ murein hydrolase activator NlpD
MFDSERVTQRNVQILAGITAVLLLLGAFLFLHDLTVLGKDRPVLATPLASGGGEYEVGPLDQITDGQRQEIQTMLAKNIEMLRENGRLSAPTSTDLIAFGWPLKLKDGLTDPGYHTVYGFVDHNPAYPDQLLDYACSNRTYDTDAGYNHRGTDFFLWPFPWNKMDVNEVEIVAAASGRIIGKHDGNDDRSCSFDGNPDWNAVYVQHIDGSVAWYGHMKKGSLTTKSIGQTVQQGEYLGLVGSSGISTGPHLHFEVYRSAGSNYPPSNLIDPYAGSCNSKNGNETWWAAQRPYYDSAVNKLTTGFAPVDFTSCPNPTITNEEDLFSPGNTIYFTAYYRDQLNSQESVNTVRRPDGSVFASWITRSNADDGHYASSYWWQSYQLPGFAPEGIWTYEVLYEGGLTIHEFFVEIQESFLPVIRKDPSPTPTPTLTATPTLTPTLAATATLTATATITSTTLPTITPTLTITTTATLTPTSLVSQTARIIATLTPEATPLLTATP